MGATRRNLRARHKILKKLSKHQINQSERKFSKNKVFLVPQKCTKVKNLYGSYQTKVTRGAQKTI
jgi:hypothetical protein